MLLVFSELLTYKDCVILFSKLVFLYLISNSGCFHAKTCTFDIFNSGILGFWFLVNKDYICHCQSFTLVEDLTKEMGKLTKKTLAFLVIISGFASKERNTQYLGKGSNHCIESSSKIVEIKTF